MVAHLLLTDDLALQIADAVRQGVPLETATQAAGIHPRQSYEWLAAADRGTWHDGSPVTPGSLRVITSFSEQIQRAQADFEAKQVASIARAAATINEKTGIPEWRAGAWLLNNHPRYRATYRQERTTTVEQTGTVRHEHTLARQLEPEALEAAYQALESLPDGSENRKFSEP